MRTLLAIVAAIALLAIVLFGLYQCGPLGLQQPSDPRLDTAERDPMLPAVYDDETLDVPAPNYQTVRLPEAERLQLEKDAEAYIAELATPSGAAVDGRSASQFVGADQTLTINGEQVSLQSILDDSDGVNVAQAADGTIYYIHTVKPTDSQGVWGIVQNGLKDKFARGLAIQRAEETQIFRVEIPDDADEKEGLNSSFLGRVLYQKVADSLVYNRQNGKMGRNPDVIFPGQELVIIEFQPAELVSVYEYFITEGQR